MAGEVVQPKVFATGFTCPHCQAYANQLWGQARFLMLYTSGESVPGNDHGPRLGGQAALNTNHVESVHLAHCSHCLKMSIWVRDTMVWPPVSSVAYPNDDMPLAVREDYQEAAAILQQSPRGAAAILRLAVQKLCVELGGTGKSLDSDIAAMVAGGLDPRVQKALDVVRVVGNNAVHPGEIDLRDDAETAGRLFGLINLICEIMITQKKALDEMFGSLPAGALAAIERRDKRK